jgi:hypothetical protein
MNTDELKKDFLEVARIARTPVAESDLFIERLGVPHTATNLRKGTVAAYIFLLGDRCLKVGKAGPNSNARFLSQHYNPASSRSNLATSILNNKERVAGLAPPNLREAIGTLDDSTISQWIKDNTTRINFFMPAKPTNAAFVLNLLEAFLQCRLCPEFEGKVPEFD